MSAIIDNVDGVVSPARRDWLKGMGALTGLSLVVGMSGTVFAADAKKYGGDAMPGGTVDNPLVFLSIGQDGIVTIVAHRPEMGQGIRTGLPLVVADELEADWARVRVIQAPGDEAVYGNQNTDGSRSMRHFFDAMRRAGASGRMMLEAAAAQRWGVPLAQVRATRHEVVHAATNRRLGYGELAQDAAKVALPAQGKLRLKKPKDFIYIGKAQPRSIDVHNVVTGNTQYGIDTRLEGMVYAVIARPLVLGGKVVKFDSAAALKVPGVLKVVELKGKSAPPLFNPLGGIAVIASNTWAAMKGREALVIEWDDGAHASYDSAAYKTTLQEAARAPGRMVRNQGDTMKALAAASGKTVQAEYYLPHLAHATMEPPAATARIVGGKCEVWACVQAPQGTRETVAASLGMKIEDVTVNITLLGGAFGRKSKPDFVAEAALLSKAMDGKPVKVTWTRDDDLRGDYFHTVSVERLEAAVDAKGRPTAWLHRTVAPTIASTFVAGAQGEAAFELGMSAINVPFNIPNLRVESPGVEAHTRIGWFRSVSNIPHAFAVQCFVAELADKAGRDHREYLLDLLGPARKISPASLSDEWNYGESPDRYPVDIGRMRHVVELATQKAGWGRKLPKGRGLGLALSYSFVTYVATVVEVEVDKDGEIIVHKVDVAVDCGPQVTPDAVRNQVEGACVMGLGLAKLGEITFAKGAAQQTNFHQFEVLRHDAAPKAIHVHLVPHDYATPLGGVGEPALPPFAPALCNAIFAATGKRIRNLPIRDQLKA